MSYSSPFKILALLALSGCGGGDSPLEVKSPYPSYTATTRASYLIAAPGGKKIAISSDVVGEKTVAGKSFPRVLVNNPDDEAAGQVEFYGNLLAPKRFELAGGEYTMSGSEIAPLAGLLGVPTAAAATLDTPLDVDFDIPVGDSRTVEIKGMVSRGENATPEASQTTATYTLKEKGVTVQTAMGPVADCWRFEVAGVAPKFLGAPTEIAGEAWYSPTLGLVKAQASKPFKDLGMDFTGNADLLDLGDGWASVHKVGIVGGGTANFRLSTYDLSQAFDADKETHAKMFVEIRWVNEETAKTDKKPYVELTFGTVMGVFPSSLTQSPVSVFHPEENDQGFVYWVGFVDQAAKNEPENGIAYRIEARYEPDFSPIRLTARIVYKRIAGAQ